MITFTNITICHGIIQLDSPHINISVVITAASWPINLIQNYHSEIEFEFQLELEPEFKIEFDFDTEFKFESETEFELKVPVKLSKTCISMQLLNSI